ncbi:hypothetical protein CK203_068454 [Vitis vinifera]|uniref:Uncharacterized protein n=1 Tax=Vitis vinifera TaxID=29760 RepID=A0A438F391_VITVI|nr:hypothetical protein CK203_068454 [Vitis vinifera]
MWLKEEGFKELLKGWWQGFNYSGSYSFVLSEKLKALKVKLKNWNKEVFGKMGVNLRMALDKVSFWDDQERQRALNKQELEARKEVREEFKKVGDYGGNLVEAEIKTNMIKFNGNWLSEDQEIQREVVRAYQDLLSDPGDWHPIPKKGGAEDLRDYRPISLVGGLYKILAKVLANRLKKVVSKVVSPTQNVFVEGRQILDAALIANEVIDSLLKGDEAGGVMQIGPREGLQPY